MDTHRHAARLRIDDCGATLSELCKGNTRAPSRRIAPAGAGFHRCPSLKRPPTREVRQEQLGALLLPF